MEENADQGAADAFYELEIDGVTYRVSRQETAATAAAILAGHDDADEAIARAFGGHPQVETDVVTEIDPDLLV
ncbi:MAG TPA: hypothetical protein VN837_15325 [Chloroflexota bacterium]|nr:hypothetical protein [Chloroflexota bacterium]